MGELKRRHILGGAGVGIAALATEYQLIKETHKDKQDNTSQFKPSHTATNISYPFRGTHQQGITTPAQDRLMFAAFDVITNDSVKLSDMLVAWTTASQEMCEGKQVSLHSPGTDADSPDDTGETLGDNIGRLTITIGYGASLYSKMKISKPSGLITLPGFATDEIDPSISHGDIAIQACADDPEIAFHAVRNLARLGTGVVRIRWIQSGFGRTSSTSPAQETPRNLMGFKDGTRNVTSNEHKTLDNYVWNADGSTFMVVRKIRMHLEKWDHDGLNDQENTFGRHKASGAPFTGTKEFDVPDFHATNPDGSLTIPAHAHIRLAAPEQNHNIHILRRGYSFEDGIYHGGMLDGGLFFIAYMKSISQFIEIQTQLSKNDNLNEYIKHISSAVFYVPAGLTDKENWSMQLFR